MTRYELLDRIGVGGMAEIFRGKAVAAGGFEKPVAIKRIRPHLSQDRRFVELLIAEAKVLSLLKHRNIVQIFDVGLGDDGQYFLVMEFVDGKDLGAIERVLEQQRRRLPFDLVLHIGAEICEALEHAHTARAPDGRSMSLVHRDVSPSNVLLSRSGEVKLTDFGIAKRAEQDVTHGGAVRGKFAYISPEQARNEQLDPRADVFSTGIVLWELICNRRLFSQLDDLAALRAVREAHVPRPTEIDPRLPPEIDQIMMTALAKDKTRRFPTAGAFGAKLRALRYSLERTVGDPASELAKIIDSTEASEGECRPMLAVDAANEMTVIRIRTADAFSERDNDASIVKAREVIDRFEEEETRLAQLSDDQLKILRQSRDSNEMTVAAEPLTRERMLDPPEPDTPPYQGDEATVLVAKRSRRTPQPVMTIEQLSMTRAREERGRPPSAPPPVQVPSTLQGAPSPVVAPAPIPPTPAALPPPPFPPQLQQPNAPLPYAQTMPAPGYPGPNWGPPIAAQQPQRDATPTSQDTFERPAPGPRDRPSVPQVAGFGPRKTTIEPWMLVVGAVVMAVLAFLITRLFIR